MLEKIEAILAEKGYLFFKGDRNINLIGVRNNNELTNEFDDRLFVIIELNGQVKVKEFDNFTTDPGEYYSKHKFLNPDGVAILAPGQYRGMFALGKHQGKYDALVQIGKCTVYRDDNRDETIDVDTKDEGRFGINMHHAYDAEEINKNSAGCQVHSEEDILNYVLQLCRVSSEVYGNSFTYTLIESKDFDETADAGAAPIADEPSTEVEIEGKTIDEVAEEVKETEVAAESPAEEEAKKAPAPAKKHYPAKKKKRRRKK